MASGNLAGQIDGFLQNYGSPMAGLGKIYVAAGKKWGVDPRLPAAISIAESSGGKHPLGSYNAWGWGPGIPFSSWEDGIYTVTKGLKTGYLNQGLTTPAKIVSKYAPSSDGNDEQHWSQTVADQMRAMGASPALTVALASTPAVKTTPSSTLPSSDMGALDAALKQLTSAPPSTAGLQNAALTNLSRIATSGRASGLSLLSGMSYGIGQDSLLDAQRLKQATDLKKIMQAVRQGLTSGGNTPEATTPPKASDSPSATSYDPTKFKPGSPVPVNALTSIGGEHETGNLPGYPAHDYMAKAGTPVLAPVGGTIVRFSGHDPANGPIGINGGRDVNGAFGWSIYLQGVDGRSYYLTHLGSRDVQVGQKVKAGTVLGAIGDFAKWGGADHVHMGVHS